MKRFIAVIITVVLLFVVVPFALAGKKAESTEVQILREKLTQCVGRLTREYNTNIQGFRSVEPEPKPEATEAKEKKE